MLNRTNVQPNESLEVRRTVSGELREQLRDLPPTPFDWGKFDANAMLGLTGVPVDLRLQAMTRLLCTAPARSHELRALWKECVATAAYAWRLAPAIGADPDTSAIAGLLHRLGDLLTIRGIAEIEHASRLRLDATSKRSCASSSAASNSNGRYAPGVSPPAPPLPPLNGAACANSPPRPRTPRPSTWRACLPLSC